MEQDMKKGKGKHSGFLSSTRTTNAMADDASTKIKGGHVNDGATRDKTAPAQPTIGPRVA